MILGMKKFFVGFIAGGLFSWTAEESMFANLSTWIGVDPRVSNDYLSIKSPQLSLEEKRKHFLSLLEERGPSSRLLFLISEANYKMLETSSTSTQVYGESEVEVLEDLFRKYYPELFDQRSGSEFISSLRLKTKCNDHNIPRVLRPG